MERRFDAFSPIRRVGLISPYTGGNLGNGAIISATIANIRKRVPDVEIIGITLNREDTQWRHGIAGFPLTGVPGRYCASGPAGFETQETLWGRIKQWLKRLPLLGRALRAIRPSAEELVHIQAAARMIRKLDVLIVPGGGALDDTWGGPWAHPWSLLKFGVLSRIFGVPFLFVSVGKESLACALSRGFARTALKLAAYRSFRENDSKAEVQKLLRSPRDPVYPDLAYSYPSSSLPTRRYCASPDERLVVAVSPIAYCDPQAWPVKDEQRYLTYIRKLAEMVKWLIKQEYRVLLFATDGPDVRTVAHLQALISDGSVDSTSAEVLPGPPAQTVDGLLQRICEADLVIASRLHGIILPHLLAIPVLAISYCRKVDVHMSDAGQDTYCVNIDRFDADELISRFNVLKDSRACESANLARIAEGHRESASMQYDLLFGAAESSTAVKDNQLVKAVEA